MPEESSNQAEPITQLTALTEQSVTSSASGATSPKKAKSSSKKLAIVAKRTSWRITGLYFWAMVLARLLGFTANGAGAAARTAAFLSSIGFAPVDPNNLAMIAKIGWALIVTSFKPIEMIGLVFYIVFFPTFPLVFYLTHGIDSSQNSKEADDANRQLGLIASSSRRLAIPVCGLSLLAWFLLFGDTSARRPMILGAILSGALFFLFAARAFQRVRPAHEPDPNFLRVAKLTGVVFLKSCSKQIKDETIKTKTAAIVIRRFNAPFGWFYRRLAIWTRGKRGRNRIYLLVLTEYVASLILLAATMIFFWALADKAMLSPTTAPLKYFLGLVSSAIFPGIPAYTPPAGLPKMMLIGPSITAWVLFVLYAGPASSNLPMRQNAYAHNVETSHRVFRSLTVGYSKYVKCLRELEKKFS